MFESRTDPRSKFPKHIPGKPNIFANAKEPYPCFCISDIYSTLFISAKTRYERSRPPLISITGIPHIPKNGKEALAFILPDSLFSSIESMVDKDGKPYVKDYDYKEFFVISTNNIKITKLLFNFFSAPDRDAEKNFIKIFQAHFIQILSSADYSNPQLKNYLCTLADKAIFPARISPAANKAFHALIDSGEHNSISTAIANIFIASMLGLYSMKYKDSDSKRNYIHVRTYLLNKLGMEFICTPETITDTYVKLQDALYAYANKNFSTAYTMTLSWLEACNSTAKPQELASAYHILGDCLYHHPKHCDHSKVSKTTKGKLYGTLPLDHFNTNPSSKDEQENRETQAKMRTDAVAFLEKSISFDKSFVNPQTLFILYEHYIEKGDCERGFEYLKKSFDTSYIEAVAEVAKLFLEGNYPFNDLTKEALVENLSYFITHEQDYPVFEVGNCLYLRGRLYSIFEGYESSAEADYESAAKRGHERAKQEISRKKRNEQQRPPSFLNDVNSPCCCVNSFDGNNILFLSTFPDNEWSLFTIAKDNQSDFNAIVVEDIEEFIKTQKLGTPDFNYHKTVFSFMSADEDRNLNECLILLDKLFNIALDLSANERNSLIDCIDIYVYARYEIASMFIDSNISDMGSNIYFRVHIMDEARDSVHYLLCEAPLFIPCIDRSKSENSANVVLFGCTETNYCFIKESIGCAYLGEAHPVNITMLGENAEHMKKKLRQECPGIYHEPKVSCIRPDFITCCIENTDFPNYIYGDIYNSDPDDELVRTLSSANYFVVDLSNDYDSILFAMNLRTWLLRSCGTFDRTPFIAVKCKNSQNSYLAAHLTLSGQPAGNTYYSRYDIFPFGTTKEIYSYSRLIENPRLEEVALNIHKSYYGDEGTFDIRLAENDYYSFSYNSDSSLLTAIGLSYRLFAGKAFFDEKEKYLNYGAFSSLELLSTYIDTITPQEDRAAALEQERWNGFMLSRGWESADAATVHAYKGRSTGSSHKHILAKLHPFIREWSDLESDDIKRILGMLSSKFDYTKSPKKNTRKSIKDTQKFLSSITTSNEKTH